MVDDDLTLLDRWRRGDRAAGNELFARYFDSLFRFFDSKVERGIDDLVQRTLLACLDALNSGRFRRESSFRTYLFGIARNMLHEHWKRERPMIDVDEISVASLSTSVGSRMVRGEDQARLVEALRSLPMGQQVLLELHYWEGLDGKELAGVFDVAEATTRSRLFRARQALRERLDASAPRGALRLDDFDGWARSLRPEPEPDPEHEPG